jgi:hypothetical protein
MIFKYIFLTDGLSSPISILLCGLSAEITIIGIWL